LSNLLEVKLHLLHFTPRRLLTNELTQRNLLKSSKMPISMKGQGWKNNIVVVEGRGGRRVRRR